MIFFSKPNYIADPNDSSEEEWIELTIPKCGCSKLVPRLDPSSEGHNPPTDEAEYTERNGTCESSTWARGFGQKARISAEIELFAECY